MINIEFFGLTEFINMHNEIIKALTPKYENIVRKDDRQVVVFAFQEKNNFLAQSVILLMNNKLFDSVKIINRALLESVINMGVLAKTGIIDDELDKYRGYLYYEGNKLNNQLNNYGMPLGISQEALVIMKDELQKYESLMGTNNTKNWSGNNLFQLCEKLDVAYKTHDQNFYRNLYLIFYKDASSNVHSTHKSIQELYLNKFDDAKAVADEMSSSLQFTMIFMLNSCRFLGQAFGDVDIEAYATKKLQLFSDFI